MTTHAKYVAQIERRTRMSGEEKIWVVRKEYELCTHCGIARPSVLWAEFGSGIDAEMRAHTYVDWLNVVKP